MTGVALLRHVASIEARNRLTYRADFWLNTLGGLAAQVAISTLVVLAVFREGGQDAVEGFSTRGLVLYYVMTSLLGGLVASNSMEMLVSRDIYECLAGL